MFWLLVYSLLDLYSVLIVIIQPGVLNFFCISPLKTDRYHRVSVFVYSVSFFIS